MYYAVLKSCICLLYYDNCRTFAPVESVSLQPPYGGNGALWLIATKRVFATCCKLIKCVKLYLIVFTLSIATARRIKLIINNLNFTIMAKTKQNSVNEVKKAKAVQVVTDAQAFKLLRNIRKNINSFGSLRYIMQITNNFAYSLSETKVKETDTPVIKVGKKSFYLSPVGAVNETNVLNVIKSVLKVEDAKRILAKKQANRLTFEQFSKLSETKKRLDDIKAAVKEYAGVELSEKQVKDKLHELYNKYLKSLGLDE